MTPEQAPSNATGGEQPDINNMSVDELLKLCGENNEPS